MSVNQDKHSCIRVVLHPLRNVTGTETDCVSAPTSASGQCCTSSALLSNINILHAIPNKELERIFFKAALQKL